MGFSKITGSALIFYGVPGQLSSEETISMTFVELRIYQFFSRETFLPHLQDSRLSRICGKKNKNKSTREEVLNQINKNIRFYISEG